MGIKLKVGKTYKVPGHPLFSSADGLYGVIDQCNGNKKSGGQHYVLEIYRSHEIRDLGEPPLCQFSFNVTGAEFNQFFSAKVLYPNLIFSLMLEYVLVLNGGVVMDALTLEFTSRNYLMISGLLIRGKQESWIISLGPYDVYVLVLGVAGIGVYKQGSDQYRQSYRHLLQIPRLDGNGNQIGLVWSDWESDDLP